MKGVGFTAAVGAVAILAACAGAPGPVPVATGGLAVVTTTTVLADFVRRVGGNRVTVTSVVPPTTDVHAFSPAPSDRQPISTARLIVMNGLGLDDWLTPAIRDAGAVDTPLIKLGESVAGAMLIANRAAAGRGSNPHLWLDATYARAYAATIAAELVQVDPAGKTTYDTNLATYDTELLDLDTWLRGQIGPLPPASRTIVSLHDAFPYFARAYGLDVVGVLEPVPGREPGATETAALVASMNSTHVAALLAEAQFDDGFVQTVAKQTGTKVVENLYDDSLGDSITSYEELMRFDTNQLMVALK